MGAVSGQPSREIPVTDNDFEYNEFTVAFMGRVPDAAQRVREVLAPTGLIGIVEGPHYQQRSTSAQLILAGPEEGTVFVADEQGAVAPRTIAEVIDAQIIAGLRPTVAFMNEECVFGAPLPAGQTEENFQTWAVFAGTGLRPEHMVIATAKDKGATFNYWEADGCGFVRYTGERRYHRFSFPPEAGVVTGLIPAFEDFSLVVFAQGLRLEFEFSDRMVLLESFPTGSEAARWQQVLWDDWFDLTEETFTQLGQATGNPRAAAELQRRLHTDSGIDGLRELLRHLGISRTVMDYAVSGQAPQGARIFEPKGTLDRVRIIRSEIAQRTGQKPSFGAGLRLLNSAG